MAKNDSDYEDYHFEHERMAIIGEDGEIHYEYVDSLTDASILGTYWNAVDEYLRTGDIEQFDQFDDLYITTRDGEEMKIITDPDVIDELYEDGEIGGEDQEEFFVYEP